MRSLLVVALLSSAAYGEAARQPPPQASPPQQASQQVPPPAVRPSSSGAATCPAPKGTPLFEARYAGATKQVVTRLYPTGTFTRVVITGQTAKTDKTSCIDKGRLAKARKAIDRAAWQTTKAEATCAATGETTDIFVGGKKRFSAKLCNPLVLDEASSTALDLVAAFVGPFGLGMTDETVAN